MRSRVQNARPDTIAKKGPVGDMYEVSVEALFSAAHRLRLADGNLEPPHGHDWRVSAHFVGAELDEIGVLIDFVAAEARLREIAARLHHTDLNQAELLAGMNPSAEHVAKVIFDKLAVMPEYHRLLDRVTVTEAPGCRATYRRA